MRRFSYLFAIVLLLLLFHSTVSFGQAWSGALSSARAMDWSYAGIPGGIPSGSWANCVTTACNTAFSNPTAANINSALSSAPNNTIVRIPSGAISGTIFANRSNVVLRGAGPTHTTLTGTVLMGNGSSGQGSAPGGLGSTGLVTLTKGSTVLTVASTTGMSSGQIVAVYEANAAYVNPNGQSGNENATWCPSPSLSFFGCSSRSQSEMQQITSVNAGTNQITVTPGLSKTYTSGSTPAVVYWSTSGVYSDDGVENMTVNANGNDFAVSFVFCNFCWAKNVAVTHIARSGMYSFFGYRDELRDSYISASNTAGAPTEYGVEIDRSTLTKLENNIFFGVTSPVVMESQNAAVISYNYTLNTATDNVFPTLDEHRSHTWMNLLEGNVTSKIQLDNVWGSGSHDTTFRTYARGTDPNKFNYRTAIDLDAFHRYNNLIANVLGDPAIAIHYACDAVVTSVDLTIYDLGGFNACGTTPYDAVVESSLVRWGNWDAMTYKASGSSHLGTRWCTGSGTGSAGADAFNTACTASETASSDPTFAGLASPSTSLPASFYLAAKPYWWGAVAWPPIGPDVTGGNIANTGGHANQIPAQVCYNNTAKDANGFLTAFDADACYASNLSQLPSPPTGLTVTVN